MVTQLLQQKTVTGSYFRRITLSSRVSYEIKDVIEESEDFALSNGEYQPSENLVAKHLDRICK